MRPCKTERDTRDENGNAQEWVLRLRNGLVRGRSKVDRVRQDPTGRPRRRRGRTELLVAPALDCERRPSSRATTGRSVAASAQRAKGKAPCSLAADRPVVLGRVKGRRCRPLRGFALDSACARPEIGGYASKGQSSVGGPNRSRPNSAEFTGPMRIGTKVLSLELPVHGGTV